MESSVRVSVLTPTHNRADKIGRLYQSLCQSTYKNFEWIIIDDGSTDNTREVITSWIGQSPFPIEYIYQENSGKYVALNKLYALARGEYCFQIDDDDELLPTAMERGTATWDNMPDGIREKTWCVCGLCRDAQTGATVGGYFPDNINELSENEKKRALKAVARGERCGFQKVCVVQQFKFPIIEGCKFIPEGYLWNKISSCYDQWYCNEVFRVYHQFEGECLSHRPVNKARFESDFNLYRYILSTNNRDLPYNKIDWLKAIYFLRRSVTSLQLNEKEITSEMNFKNKFAFFLFRFPCWLLRKRRGE